MRHEVIDADDRNDDVGAGNQAWAELPFGGFDQVGLAAVEPDVGGGTTRQAAHESVDEATALRRLEGNLERLPADPRQRGVGKLDVAQQVADFDPVVRHLDVGNALHQPEGHENDAVQHRDRDEGNDRLVLDQLDDEQHHQDDEKPAVEPLAVVPALDRVEDRVAALGLVAHRATRTVPVRSIRWSAPSK